VRVRKRYKTKRTCSMNLSGVRQIHLSPVSPHTGCLAKCQWHSAVVVHRSVSVPCRWWPGVHQGDAPAPQPASTHGQGSALDLYYRHGSQRGTACRCYGARCGWPKVQSWPCAEVRGSLPRKSAHGLDTSARRNYLVPRGVTRDDAVAHMGPLQTRHGATASSQT
jgi:hypothetical protein